MNKKNTISKIDELLKRLFPIYRSLTGPGNHQTLKILQENIPLTIKEFKSGKKVYDWVIPDEYDLRNAWIKTASGEKIVDFKDSNLHVVSYSVPVDEKISFKKLSERLFYLSDLPEAIPYRTTYYSKEWGFCVTKSQFDKLSKETDKLHVFIDSRFNPNGKMVYGDFVIKGQSDKEILISTYICHPSMANDNLSGPIMSCMLAKELMSSNYLNYSYRFIFVPETIGAIAYCHAYEKIIKEIDIGLIASTVGGPGQFEFKESWDSSHRINSIIENVFKKEKINYKKHSYDPHGSDERQFSSQKFRINCPVISKDKFYEYDYYHTSLDNLDFVKPENIFKSLKIYKNVIMQIEKDKIYKNKKDSCEVMLGKHDLYPKTGGAFLPKFSKKISELDLTLWLLHLSDGKLTTHQIADILKIEEEYIDQMCKKLVDKKIFEKI